MTRTQIQQIVVIILLLVFIGVWTTTRKPSGDKAASAAARSAEVATSSSQASPASAKTIPPKNFSLARDPFMPTPMILGALKALEMEKKRQEEEERRRRQKKVTEPKPAPIIQIPIDPPSLKVQGVLWGPTKPQAIINRKVISVGETIEGARVAKITREAVTVSFKGQKFTFRISDAGGGDL